TVVYSGIINNLDTSDVYRFSVTDLDFGFISVPRTVNITLSGMSGDLDIRLIKDANSNGIVDSGDVLTSSSYGSNTAEWMSRTLGTGNYFLQVNQFGSANSNYHLSVSTGDWYSSNLSDAGIIGEARYADYYGGISRNDMINILREAKDGGSISGTELTDLRTLLSGKGSIMPESVRVLSNKLLNGDLANGRSGIGNLFSGSSATQMENLIGKWFLGTDRPDASGTYRYASGSLFQGGISYTDIDQGSVGDCYFLAALGSTAYQSPSMIQNMFTDNGDGTFTVRFFNNGVADYVTVDRYLPTTAGGNRVYAGWGGGSYTETNNELWVALAEKAYAQVNESGWLGRSVSENSYTSIGWGNGGNAMREITGQTTQGRGIPTDWWAGDLIERVVLINSLNAGAKITMGTLDFDLADSRVVADHEYSLVGYNSTTGRFKLFNPWGTDSGAANPGILELTWDEIQANFGYWSRTV
ncbi:MAG: C2 family cysteine protease, partial [Synechococcales bacterium]|nr:C2 family cysteine protease [Synechococcales bacterium]